MTMLHLRQCLYKLPMHSIWYDGRAIDMHAIFAVALLALCSVHLSSL